MNRGQYHLKREAVVRVLTLNTVDGVKVINRTEEMRKVYERRAGPRFVRADYGLRYDLNASNEYHVRAEDIIP